ncbi:PREDICTED: late histone H2B.L4-like [Papilio polytes]|uniref:late histone H2B.L4-like n=1 Tax=Papilio polytes TaxID=76194 RepID=UPI000675FF0D|nr:PREDICTED: late histone H2B.L4-like [Papilio polytes]
MAPVKKPKNALKSMDKPIEKPILKNKNKTGKKNNRNFASYIYKVLKSVVEDRSIGISKKSMLIMNNFVNDMIEKIAEEAGRLVLHSKRSTLSGGEVRTAIKLLIPGELANHAMIEGTKAVKAYYDSKEASDSTN